MGGPGSRKAAAFGGVVYARRVGEEIEDRKQAENVRLKIIDQVEARRDSLKAIIGIANSYIYDNDINITMRIKYLSLGLIFSLFLILAVTAETDKEWQEANGGWIVVKNSHQYNTNGPFQPCPGQEGCIGYPLHVEHGVCINVVAFADPDVGSKWTPPTDNIILAFDCGYPSGWNTANCPVVTEFWVPAGTYDLTEFTFVSEVNPGDPDYSPCTNAWSKPTSNAVIRPGDRIDFGESIFIGSGNCTAGGYPCPGTGGLSSGRSNIGGTWYMGGPYNEGMACQIIQEGDSLTFINENGQQSSGRFIFK